MSGRVVLYLSTIVILVGVVILAFYDPTPVTGETSATWTVPVAYFLMLAGAVGMCFGWFYKRRR